MADKIFRSNISPAGSGYEIDAIRGFAKNEPENFLEKIQKGADSGKLTLAGIRDIKELFRNLYDVQVPVVMEVAGMQRAITASAFPVLTGTLAIAAMNDAYNAVATIGQNLVTEIEDNKKVTTLANVETLDKNIEEVKETEDFPEIGTEESKVEIRHKRNGRKLTISQEAIDENEIPNIVSKINKLGEITNEWVEEQTLNRVTDHAGCGSSPAEPYVYRPEGTGTQLYNATANNPGTRAPSGTRVNSNALVDETDLDAARAVLAAMKNSRGKRISIPWSEVVLLVPNALIGVASKIFNSELTPGTVNEVSNYGPRGRWSLPAERIISSTKMDDLSAAAWYLGAFKRQFKRKWKLRFEYVTLGTDTQAYLNSRIAFQARIAWDVEIGAVDYVYTVQSIAATTAPIDE